MNLLRKNKLIHPYYIIDDFLSDDEIESIKNYAKNLNPEEAKIGVFDYSEQEKESKKNQLKSHIKNTNTGIIKRKRDTIVKWIRNNSETLWLFDRLIDTIQRVNCQNFHYFLKFFEDIQFGEYNSETQGFYSKHQDHGYEEHIDFFVTIRKLSFVIQLSDSNEYEGGNLILYLNSRSPFQRNGIKFVVPKKKGSIIFFSSNIPHEVTKVISGVRYSLVSWIQGPPS